MKVIVADTCVFYTNNSKNTKFPKEFKNHRIIWNMRNALLELWQGKISELVLPELGTPGYDYVEFIDNLVNIGQLKNKPIIKYYQMNVVK